MLQYLAIMKLNLRSSASFDAKIYHRGKLRWPGSKCSPQPGETSYLGVVPLFYTAPEDIKDLLSQILNTNTVGV